MIDNDESNEAFWDEHYRQSEQIWSGNPNAELVKEVSTLSPGRALDLGCGEGGDAIWLAQQGWSVTAVDVSPVALERAARHAESAGVGGLIDWQHHDLADSFPQGSFDLVSAQFLHSHRELAREEILRSAAAAVAPGGVLMIVGHGGFPAWEHQHDHDVTFPTPTEVLTDLRLPEGQWEVLRCEEHPRIQNDPQGRPTTRTDNTVLVRRLPR